MMSKRQQLLQNKSKNTMGNKNNNNKKTDKDLNVLNDFHL